MDYLYQNKEIEEAGGKASIIITADSKEQADHCLNDLVKNSNEWVFIEEAEEQNNEVQEDG